MTAWKTETTAWQAARLSAELSRLARNSVEPDRQSALLVLSPTAASRSQLQLQLMHVACTLRMFSTLVLSARCPAPPPHTFRPA